MNESPQTFSTTNRIVRGNVSRISIRTIQICWGRRYMWKLINSGKIYQGICGRGTPFSVKNIVKDIMIKRILSHFLYKNLSLEGLCWHIRDNPEQKRILLSYRFCIDSQWKHLKWSIMASHWNMPVCTGSLFSHDPETFVSFEGKHTYFLSELMNKFQMSKRMKKCWNMNRIVKSKEYDSCIISVLCIWIYTIIE